MRSKVTLPALCTGPRVFTMTIHHLVCALVMGIDYRIHIIIISSKTSISMHTTRVANTPCLRTRDGGLKIFHDWSTLPTHPVPKTLMHNDLHFTYLRFSGNLQKCGLAKAVAT